MKRIIIDLDGTLTFDEEGVPYPEKKARIDVIDRLRHYRTLGFSVVVMTARNMNTYGGNVGLINIKTVPTILRWLEENDVPFDELVVGKPWCGREGFYVDDRAVRPDEFVSLEPQEVSDLFPKKKRSSL